jgi:hypothetical protein
MDNFNFFSHINWIGVIVVTILSFALGALWHSPVLFGKTWSKEIQKGDTRNVNFKFIFGFSAVANFTALVALNAFIGSNSTLFLGLAKGLIVGIFWISTSIAVTYLFASRSLKLFLIDAGFYVVFMSLAGAIFGIW